MSNYIERKALIPYNQADYQLGIQSGAGAMLNIQRDIYQDYLAAILPLTQISGRIEGLFYGGGGTDTRKALEYNRTALAGAVSQFENFLLGLKRESGLDNLEMPQIMAGRDYCVSLGDLAAQYIAASNRRRRASIQREARVFMMENDHALRGLTHALHTMQPTSEGQKEILRFHDEFYGKHPQCMSYGTTAKHFVHSMNKPGLTRAQQEALKELNRDGETPEKRAQRWKEIIQANAHKLA